jgi:hypothetical protein
MKPISRDYGIKHVVFLLSLAAVVTPAVAQTPALMRYNTAVESRFLLERCGVLTPERNAWVRRQIDSAKRPLDWMTPDQWSAHDAGLAKELERLYPSVPKERCAELVQNLELEMKNPLPK